MRPHGVVTETTKLMARHRVLARRREARAHFRNKSWNDHGVHIGIGQKKSMHHIGTGKTELHRRVRRHLNATWHKIILLSDDPHRDGTVGLDSRAQIAFDKLAIQMKGLRFDDLDIAGRMQRADDSGYHNDSHHEAKHCGHGHEPALLRPGDNFPGNDAVRRHSIQRI